MNCQRRLVATCSTKAEWRKQQLDKITKKFQEPLSIRSDDELQPTWRSMESRVTKRRTLTKEERGGKTGRTNVRPTDEEAWLRAGLYDDDDEDDKKSH
jgi:polyribonucleotide nucleotidyltransferase